MTTPAPGAGHTGADVTRPGDNGGRASGSHRAGGHRRQGGSPAGAGRPPPQGQAPRRGTPGQDAPEPAGPDRDLTDRGAAERHAGGPDTGGRHAGGPDTDGYGWPDQDGPAPEWEGGGGWETQGRGWETLGRSEASGDSETPGRLESPGRWETPGPPETPSQWETPGPPETLGRWETPGRPQTPSQWEPPGQWETPRQREAPSQWEAPDPAWGTPDQTARGERHRAAHARGGAPGRYEEPGRAPDTPEGLAPEAYPPGTYPSGTNPPDTYPPGAYPPGTYPPGTYPSRAYRPESFPPGGYAPDWAAPEGLAGERFAPDSLAPGDLAPGDLAPGDLAPGEPAPGGFAPGGLAPGGQEPGPAAAAPSPGRDSLEDVSVVRSSGVMALGTLASRGTGFLRTLVLAYVLGYGSISIAYNNANTLPNAVYDLMLGGILTSVVVPLLVNASKRDADGGEAYDQRMFTLGVVALLALTVVATLAASLLVEAYAHNIGGDTHHLMVIFAYFFIPQIFFYGLTSLAGGLLNARGHFAAPMWTPAINNLVVIAVLLLFIAIGGTSASAGDISAGQVQLLGFGTTLGIIVQSVALVPALRRVRFRWHPRFDFRRDEVAEIIRMAAPLFGYIVTTQIAFLVVQNVTNTASTHAAGDGFPAYSFAWQLFQMPYAIVGISVITALLPRMSAHASERRFAEVRSDFSGGVRLSSVIVVPSALILFVLGGPVADALFGYGKSAPDAGYIGVVFGIFSLGLVPYMMFQLMLRVFYAMHDSKTPMYIGVAAMVTNIVASVLSLTVLPAGHVVEGVAAAFGLANLVGTVLSWRILSHRLSGLDGPQIAGSLVRMHAAAIPAAIFGLATMFAVSVILSPGPAFGIVVLLFGGSGALLLYVLFAKALGVGEVAELAAGVKSRLSR